MGCPVCIFIINKTGKQFLLFPHLFLSKKIPNKCQVWQCPTILCRPIPKRIEIAENDTLKICKTCGYPNQTEPCLTCPKLSNMARPCAQSDLNYLFCACSSCIQRIEQLKTRYNEIMQSGPNKLKGLNLSSKDKLMLPPSATLICNSTNSKPGGEDVDLNQKLD